MKKYITVAALLAAGTAFANAEDISFATDGWTLEKNRTTGGAVQFVIDADANSMSQTNSNWSQSLAYLDIAGSVQIESFSFDVNVGNLTGSFTFSLIGDNTSFVFGKNYDNSTWEYAALAGVSSDTTKALMFKAADATNKTAYTAGTSAGVTITAGATVSVSGVVGEDNKLDLTVGDTEINDIDLGGTFDLNTIGFYGDGANNVGTNVTFSNLKVSVVPEPSAFGLLAGLGALALVASRRRRK